MTKLYITGLPTDAGRFDGELVSVDRETKFRDGVIKWRQINIPKLRLLNNAHMLLIQGMSVSNLLMSASFVVENGPAFDAPFHVLRARPSSIFEVPFFLHDLVLAQFVEAPEGTTLNDARVACFMDMR